jgi:hypothetical protein
MKTRMIKEDGIITGKEKMIQGEVPQEIDLKLSQHL